MRSTTGAIPRSPKQRLRKNAAAEASRLVVLARMPDFVRDGRSAVKAHAHGGSIAREPKPRTEAVRVRRLRCARAFAQQAACELRTARP